jgi:hypothetical protein
LQAEIHVRTAIFADRGATGNPTKKSLLFNFLKSGSRGILKAKLHRPAPAPFVDLQSAGKME